MDEDSAISYHGDSEMVDQTDAGDFTYDDVGLIFDPPTVPADEESNMSALDLYTDMVVRDDEEAALSLAKLEEEKRSFQSQLQEALTEVARMNRVNDALQKENQILRHNISVLLATAKVEIQRKDRELAELRRSQHMGVKKFGSSHCNPAATMAMTKKPRGRRLPKRKEWMTNDRQNGGSYSTESVDPNLMPLSQPRNVGNKSDGRGGDDKRISRLQQTLLAMSNQSNDGTSNGTTDVRNVTMASQSVVSFVGKKQRDSTQDVLKSENISEVGKDTSASHATASLRKEGADAEGRLYEKRGKTDEMKHSNRTLKKDARTPPRFKEKKHVSNEQQEGSLLNRLQDTERRRKHDNIRRDRSSKSKSHTPPRIRHKHDASTDGWSSTEKICEKGHLRQHNKSPKWRRQSPIRHLDEDVSTRRENKVHSRDALYTHEGKDSTKNRTRGRSREAKSRLSSTPLKKNTGDLSRTTLSNDVRLDGDHSKRTNKQSKSKKRKSREHVNIKSGRGQLSEKSEVSRMKERLSNKAKESLVKAKATLHRRHHSSLTKTHSERRHDSHKHRRSSSESNKTSQERLGRGITQHKKDTDIADSKDEGEERDGGDVREGKSQEKKEQGSDSTRKRKRDEKLIQEGTSDIRQEELGQCKKRKTSTCNNSHGIASRQELIAEENSAEILTANVNSDDHVFTYEEGHTVLACGRRNPIESTSSRVTVLQSSQSEANDTVHSEVSSMSIIDIQSGASVSINSSLDATANSPTNNKSCQHKESGIELEEGDLSERDIDSFKGKPIVSSCNRKSHQSVGCFSSRQSKRETENTITTSRIDREDHAHKKLEGKPQISLTGKVKSEITAIVTNSTKPATSRRNSCRVDSSLVASHSTSDHTSSESKQIDTVDERHWKKESKQQSRRSGDGDVNKKKKSTHDSDVRTNCIRSEEKERMQSSCDEEGKSKKKINTRKLENVTEKVLSKTLRSQPQPIKVVDECLQSANFGTPKLEDEVDKVIGRCTVSGATEEQKVLKLGIEDQEMAIIGTTGKMDIHVNSEVDIKRKTTDDLLMDEIFQMEGEQVQRTIAEDDSVLGYDQEGDDRIATDNINCGGKTVYAEPKTFGEVNDNVSSQVPKIECRLSERTEKQSVSIKRDFSEENEVDITKETDITSSVVDGSDTESVVLVVQTDGECDSNEWHVKAGNDGNRDIQKTVNASLGDEAPCNKLLSVSNEFHKDAVGSSVGESEQTRLTLIADMSSRGIFEHATQCTSSESGVILTNSVQETERRTEKVMSVDEPCLDSEGQDTDANDLSSVEDELDLPVLLDEDFVKYNVIDEIGITSHHFLSELNNIELCDSSARTSMETSSEKQATVTFDKEGSEDIECVRDDVEVSSYTGNDNIQIEKDGADNSKGGTKVDDEEKEKLEEEETKLDRAYDHIRSSEEVSMKQSNDNGNDSYEHVREVQEEKSLPLSTFIKETTCRNKVGSSTNGKINEDAKVFEDTDCTAMTLEKKSQNTMKIYSHIDTLFAEDDVDEKLDYEEEQDSFPEERGANSCEEEREENEDQCDGVKSDPEIEPEEEDVVRPVESMDEMPIEAVGDKEKNDQQRSNRMDNVMEGRIAGEHDDHDLRTEIDEDDEHEEGEISDGEIISESDSEMKAFTDKTKEETLNNPQRTDLRQKLNDKMGKEKQQENQSKHSAKCHRSEHRHKDSERDKRKSLRDKLQERERREREQKFRMEEKRRKEIQERRERERRFRIEENRKRDEKNRLIERRRREDEQRREEKRKDEQRLIEKRRRDGERKHGERRRTEDKKRLVEKKREEDFRKHERERKRQDRRSNGDKRRIDNCHKAENEKHDQKIKKGEGLRKETSNIFSAINDVRKS